MGSSYFPAFLSLQGRLAVVIGGGHTADVKVAALLDAGARVTLISPHLTRALRYHVDRASIIWVEREYQRGDLEGAWLAVAATDKSAVNAAVASEAEEGAVLLNVVDKPALSNFISPALVRRGDLVIAISTGGRSPAMARRVREEMERLFPADYGLLLEVAGDVREDLRRRGLKAPSDLWQKALSDEVQTLARFGRLEEAKSALAYQLGEGAAHEPKG